MRLKNFNKDRGIKIFILIWFGQLISLLGSGLTGFALGVWVYQRTGSVTQFALISVFTQLPGIVISPLAGALIDRWDRRWAMILSDSGAGISTLAVALLLVNGNLEIWHIYIATAVSSTFSAFQWPAYTATTTFLIPKKHLGRASGMIQLSEALARLVSPMLAGILLEIIALQGIIFIDFATFLFALVTLLNVTFIQTKALSKDKSQAGTLIQEAIYGWTYIIERPGLLSLLIFFAASNFLVGIVQILITPLVLSFSSASVLGTIMSIGGTGMLVGSLVMSSWGGPKKLINAVLGFTILGGMCLSATGVRTSIPLIATAAFTFFFCLPIINGCSQAIWQKKVASEVQGRVFAFRRMVAWSSFPIAYLVAGPLAERVFEPLMVFDGMLANSAGRIIGVGSGRGIGLMFVLMGLMTIIVTVIAYCYPRLRLVEKELPDILNF